MKILNKLAECKQWIIRIVKVRAFLLSSEKRQNYLIGKNTCMFLGLQNVAKHWDKLGDVRYSMDISSDSYKYLGNFALYCNAKGIDQVKRMKLYAP